MTFPAQTVPVTAARQRSAPAAIPWGFPEFFIISQTALPALLFLPGTQAFRLPIRTAAFAISLAAFVWWLADSKVQVRASKAQSWVAAVMALLAIMLFHPLTPSLGGGFAQIAVYFSVMAPLFWAPVFIRTPDHLARILWILLVCSGCNALVGVLQVYDPRFLPAEFSRVITGNEVAMGSVTFIGRNGERLLRPPGLFDTPGAVAGPAMSAALLGLVFAVSGIAAWKRLTAFTFAFAGLAAIYLSQVRISLVMTVLMMGVYTFTSFRQGRLGRASQFGILAGAIVLGGFVTALALGGPVIRDRVMTLLGGDPLAVYQSARGVQLSMTFTEMLYEHPLGAGVGRWGMAAAYFGEFTQLSQPLWAEIQFTGWMIDGGILMIALYCGALAVTAMTQWKVAMIETYPRLNTCAAAVLSANLGTAVLIFSFTPFVTQIGIQYWFLAGALHGVAVSHGTEGA
ncbi:MAG TPA: hypothetical protein VFK57_02815 [Vicinamibacterales bacterium]|nr:hypothetical protein [Vicinamibacterales bacterium]